MLPSSPHTFWSSRTQTAYLGELENGDIRSKQQVYSFQLCGPAEVVGVPYARSINNAHRGSLPSTRALTAPEAIKRTEMCVKGSLRVLCIWSTLWQNCSLEVFATSGPSWALLSLGYNYSLPPKLIPKALPRPPNYPLTHPQIPILKGQQGSLKRALGGPWYTLYTHKLTT